MADVDFEHESVSGRWAGFYRIPISRVDSFPLVAEFHQSGSELSGEMFDEVTDYSDDFRKVLEARGREVPLGMRLQIKLMISLYGKQSVGYRIRLPDTSDLRGRVRHERVKFIKAYRGTMLSETIVDGKVVQWQHKTGHRVHYSGRHDVVRGCISGRWSIRLGGILGVLQSARGGGVFELYKKS